MFFNTSFNQDISGWNISNVTDISSLFRGTPFNQDIGNWDTSNVISMGTIFFGTPFNQDISSWDVSNVTNMSYMFVATPFNQDISSWDVGNVTNTYRMFDGAGSFNSDISSWDVSNVTEMSEMFKGAISFNQDIGSWNVSNVVDMSRMFWNATAFNQPLNDWDVSKVTDMTYMFDNSDLSTDNYDNVLKSWSQQDVQSGVSLGALGVNYCNGADARQILIDTYGWTITDAGSDCSTAGVDDLNQLDVLIYPNPATDKLYINGIKTMATISVFDLLGKEIFSVKTIKEVDVDFLPKGVYLIKIRENQNQATIRFMKK